MGKKNIYLDNAATERISPDLVKVISHDLTRYWGNPSTIYQIGAESKALLEDSRVRIANALDVPTGAIYFTSGSSEGNAWAIAQGEKCLCSQYEHHSIVANAKSIIVDLDYLERFAQIYPEPNLGFVCSHMLVNNETGEKFDLTHFSQLAHGLQFLVHSDMTQALGKVDITEALKLVDMATFSGHKIRGPKGIGFNYFNPEIFDGEKRIITPLVYGTQENGVRGGTENVPYCHALSLAVENAIKTLPDRMSHVRELKRLMVELLYMNFFCNDFRLISPSDSSPFILNVAFKGIDGEVIAALLSDHHIYCNTGSACNDGKLDASHVLSAMDVPNEFIHGAVRFSFDENIDFEDIRHVVKTLKKIIVSLH